MGGCQANPKYFVLRALAGINLNRESLLTKKKVRQKVARTYERNMGLVGGGEIEIFLTKRISGVLSGGIKRFYWEGSTSNKNDWFLTIGFKYSLWS